MLDKLRHIKTTVSSRVLGQVIKSKANDPLYSWVLEQTNNLPHNSTITERVYVILNPTVSPQCENGYIRKFNAIDEKYNFCGNINKCLCLKAHYDKTRVPPTPASMKNIVTKRKETWIKKYGVDNPSKNSDIQAKRKRTMNTKTYSDMYSRLQYDKESDGFNTVVNRVSTFVIPKFTRDEYKGSFRKNFYKWECRTCGTEIIDHVDYGRIPRCLNCEPNGTSKVEKLLQEYIISLGFDVVANSKEILGNLEYDIWLPEKNVAIEYNGVYWHSTKWKESDYHVNKFLLSRDKGVRLIQIFEDEWLNKEGIIKSRLKNILGKSNIVYARKCNIVELQGVEYSEFVNKHHLQGNAAASFKFGLKYNDELVAVMSFSKSRYTADGYELIRYCSKDTVVGGAGKLFSYFTKRYNPTKIVSYANRCWSDGRLYETLGFKNTTVDDANTGYWYIKDNKRYHRSTFTKSKLMKMGYNELLTESDIMDSAGYLKVYDAGNYRFEWTP
jgi:G:T-mismatch repair DNA endonuclease (very short patch repair protein)